MRTFIKTLFRGRVRREARRNRCLGCESLEHRSLLAGDVGQPATSFTPDVMPAVIGSLPAPSHSDDTGHATVFSHSTDGDSSTVKPLSLVALSLTNTSVSENAPAGTIVGRLTTASPNVESFVYALVAGAGDGANNFFRIEGDNLVTTATLDYESLNRSIGTGALQSPLPVRVESRGSIGSVIEQSFSIQVLDVNEMPTDILLSTTEIQSHAPTPTLVGALTTLDEDFNFRITIAPPPAIFSYTLVAGEGDTHNALFQVVRDEFADADELFAKVPLRVGNYSLRIRSYDHGLFLEKPFTVAAVEKTGGVVLREDSDGFLRANGNVITFNGNPVPAANDSWSFLAAETIAGVNTLVLRHTSGFLHLWRLDGTWNMATAEGWYAPGSAGFATTENDFQMDFDGDTVVGNPSIEIVGNVRLDRGSDGLLRANGSLVRFNGTPVLADLANWTFLAAEMVDGINTIVLRHDSHFLHLWRLDISWNVVAGEGWLAPGSAESFKVEVEFGMDFDGDQITGSPVIENKGTTTLSRDRDGFLLANGTVVRFRGTPVSASNPDWEFLAAEPQGANTLVLRHRSGFLHLWRLDDSWNFLFGHEWHEPGSYSFQGIEKCFSMDFDGDAIVGNPILEAEGAVTLSRDQNGFLRANGTPIRFGGHHVEAVNADWKFLAAEVINGINTMVLLHVSDRAHLWRLDSAWNVVEGEGWHARGSAGFTATEEAFGMHWHGLEVHYSCVVIIDFFSPFPPT